ncbi:Surfactin synthase thioesterase subunit [Streptomyces sp. 3213]|uniref:thioesterase II family protein n=1 Tax=Streptomyces sp. 3213.3 TaxID=1855348 RepID=UPI000894CA35|nr:alpha/beta fold hydrolase [Streptomyces sp. 3213.3]SEC37922.1 Surfactin synthase thioesterase subunit [Streptomyces sp. 3213] [Streptomyces sp. 3213.3]
MSTPISTSSEWLRGYDERLDAQVRMVCFPHAGGSAVFYRSWHQGLPPLVELHAVQYPGRGERRTAPLVDDVRTMARHITDDLAPLFDRPLALFGHSMGAYIAYETARLLDERGAPPVHLFVSGQIAPWTPGDARGGGTDQGLGHPGAGIADADDEELVRHLERLGGTEAELLADRQLRQIFLPYIRNDFRMLQSYRPTAGPPLTTPITALAGADDPMATPARAAQWCDLTSSHFALEVFPGGHFFLLPEQTAVLDVVATRLGVCQELAP